MLFLTQHFILYGANKNYDLRIVFDFNKSRESLFQGLLKNQEFQIYKVILKMFNH